MNNFIHTLFVILLLVVTSCGSGDNDSNFDENSEQLEEIEVAPEFRTLEEIKESDTLRAITVYSEVSYFLYRGEPLGFEYELLERLAESLGCKLKIVVADNLNDMIQMLNSGEGDIIAHGLTITQNRKKLINFTDYLYLANQVLVQRKPENWRQMKLHEIQRELISDPIQLIDDTVRVRKNSSYYARIQNLEKEIGGEIHVDTVGGNKPTSRIIRDVVDGKIKYTVADNNIAQISSSYFSILNVKTPMSFSQRIAWGVPKGADQLLDTLNHWVGQMRKKTDYYVIYNKYFKNSRSFQRRVESNFFSKNGNKISRYDDIIQEYADKIGWDWRLVSSLIYQESRFDPSNKSWAGAGGLMQLMPRTAKFLGVDNVNDPKQNIQAGTKYLKQLYDRWDNVNDSIQRIKFTMASYNCGYSHVKDACALAEKNGDDPTQWDGSVENYLLNLSYPNYYNDPVVKYGYVRGEEPVNYVEQIFERYRHYKQFIDRSV